VTRQDDRNHETKFRQDTWKPVMPPDKRSETEKMLADAIKRAEAEKWEREWKSATPAEKEVMSYRQALAKEKETADNAAAIDAQRQRRRPWDEALTKLEARAMVDTRFSFADLVEMRNALAQIRELGSDEVTAETMVKAALGIETRVRQEILDAAKATLDEAHQEFLTLQTQLGVEDEEEPTADTPSFLDDERYVIAHREHEEARAAKDTKRSIAALDAMRAVRLEYEGVAQ
jgi:hypothetical protein